MRHRRAIVAALTLLLVGGCGSGGSDKAAPAPAAGAPGGPSASGIAAPGATTAPGAPAPGATATNGAPKGPGPGAPTGRPAARPGSGAAKPAGLLLAASGLGPYQVAVTSADLKAAGLLGTVDKAGACPGFVVATGLGTYAKPGLVFYQGKLQYTRVTSASTSTTEGVKVGTQLADVKKKYPKGKQLDDWNGAIAWFATSGSDALLFRIKNDKVESIEAGLAEPLQFRFTDGEGC
jgi:hypothetical protein